MELEPGGYYIADDAVLEEPVTGRELKEWLGVPMDDEAYVWEGGPGGRRLFDDDEVRRRAVPGAVIAFAETTDDEVKELLYEHERRDSDGLPAPEMPDAHR